MLHKMSLKKTKNKKRFELVSRIFLVCCAIFFPITQTFATIDKDTLRFYSKNNILYYDPTNSDCIPGGYSPGGNGTVYGNSVEEKIWTGLKTIVGLSDEQAAGIMGNMAHEGSFNPVIHEISLMPKYWGKTMTAKDGTTGPFALNKEYLLSNGKDLSYGIGLIGWSFGRRVNLYNYIQGKNSTLMKYFNNPESYSQNYGFDGNKLLNLVGEDIYNELIQYEMEFLRDELNSGMSNKGHKWQEVYEQTSVYDETKFFLEVIEVPENPSLNAHMDRLDSANKYYELFHNKTFTNNNSSQPSSSYTILSNHSHITFYSSDAEENGGVANVIASSLNGGKLANGMVAINKDDPNLKFGDIIYIETTTDTSKEGAYANGKFFIVADTGAQTPDHPYNIDIFHDPKSQNSNAPFGSTNSAKIYKVASGVSWEEYKSKYANSPTTPSTDMTGETVSIIGDSIANASETEFKKLLPDAAFDAEVGRPWREGLEIAKTTALRDSVVFALGSNNYAPGLKQSDIDEIIFVVGSRNLYFVTNYNSKNSSADSVYEENNTLFRKAAQENSNVHVIDWKTSVSNNPEKYLIDDGLHPKYSGTADGTKLWATLVANAVKNSVIPTSTDPCGNSRSIPGTPGNVSALQEYVKKYAWPEYMGDPYDVPMSDYKDIISIRSSDSKKYVGACGGEDCGGFVTTLLQESGFEPDYNYLYADGNNGAGQVITSCNSSGTTGHCQWRWLKEHWTLLNANENSEIDTSILQPGDVAIVRSGHTFIYVGDIEGFDKKIASASYCRRMPMAGTEALVRAKYDGDRVILWYRKGV